MSISAMCRRCAKFRGPLGDLLVYSFSTGINQGIPFLLLPIMTRYLLPRDYGLWATWFFYHQLFAFLTGSAAYNSNSRIFFSSTKQTVAVVNWNIVLVQFALLLTVAGAMVPLWWVFRRYFSLSVISLALALLTAFLLNVCVVIFTNIRNSRKPWHYTALSVGQTLVHMGAATLLIVSCGMDWRGRLVGYVTALFVFTMIGVLYLYRTGYLSFSFNTNGFQNTLQMLGSLIPNDVGLLLIGQAGLMFVGWRAGLAERGLYSIGLSLSEIVVLLYMTANYVWYPHIYELLSTSSATLAVHKKLFRQIGLAAAVYIAAAIGIALLSPQILQIMTQKAFYSASRYVLPLALGWACVGIYRLVIPIFVHLRQERYVRQCVLVGGISILLLSWLCRYAADARAYAYSFFIVALLMAARLLTVAYRINRTMI